MDLRDAAVRFGDERDLRVRLRHLHQRVEKVGRADAAIGADRQRLLRQPCEHPR
jgi:hypothetical protein